MTSPKSFLQAGVGLLALASTAAAPALAAAQNSVPMAQPPADNGGYDQGQGGPGYGPADQGPGGPGYGPGDQGPNGPGYGPGDQGPSGPGYQGAPQAPQGYVQGQMRPEDRAYQQALAQWRHDRAAYDYHHCVSQHQGAAIAGTIIGGIAGAVIGSNVAPRWDRSGGAFAGGTLGAVAGGAIGSTAGPVCGPGYGPGPGPGYTPGYSYGYGPGPYGPAPAAYYGGGPVVAGGPVVVGGPVVRYRWGPRWHRYHGYWRRW